MAAARLGSPLQQSAAVLRAVQSALLFKKLVQRGVHNCTNEVAASTAYVPRLHDTREIYLSVTRCFNNCGTLKEVNTAP
jgi:hypothetical protein